MAATPPNLQGPDQPPLWFVFMVAVPRVFVSGEPLWGKNPYRTGECWALRGHPIECGSNTQPTPTSGVPRRGFRKNPSEASERVPEKAGKAGGCCVLWCFLGCGV